MTSPVIASAGAANQAFAASVSLAAPSGIVDTNLLLIIAAMENGSGSADASCTGFTHKKSYIGTADTKLSVLYKYASSESGSYSVASVGAAYMDGIVLRVTGAVTAGDPFDVIGAGDAGTSTSPQASSITTTQADTLLLWLCDWYTTTLNAVPSGMTSVVSSTIFGVGSLAVAAIGATGAKTGTLNGSDGWGTFLGAIKSPVAAGSAGRNRTLMGFG